MIHRTIAINPFYVEMVRDTVATMGDVFAELRDLYARLAQLDEERAGVSARIARCMNALAEAPVTQQLTAAPAPRVRRLSPETFREQIYVFIASTPGAVLTPWDIAQRLGIRNDNEMKNMRGILARLTKQGLIKRVSFGRYMAI